MKTNKNSQNHLLIGIDIGGTNTDAVLIDKNENILKTSKVLTTKNIVDGFKEVIKNLLQNGLLNNIDIKNNIRSIFVGTTHATNAILQQKDLYKVGIIRISGNNPELEPCYSWPKELKEAIYKGHVTVNGGFNCDGREITKFDKNEIIKAAKKLILAGAESIAIVGTFSPINPEQELIALGIIKETISKDFPVTISSQIGGISIIERENATILNSALKKCLTEAFNNLSQVIKEFDINAELYIVQNNGTLIDIKHAIKFPILTISAGPTNSFIGGAKLAKLKNCVVIDIGGTSTDAGIVINNFAQNSLNNSNIAGINLNFRMPDVLSIALGGGSYINKNNNNNNITIGPLSSGHKVFQESSAFSGEYITLTDFAIKRGYLNIKDADKDKIKLNEHEIKNIIALIKEKINYLEKRIKGHNNNINIVLVGGGSQLFESNIFGSNYIIPKYAHVANAYGAALAEISVQIDKTISLSDRDNIIEKLQKEAIESTKQKGAKRYLRIINQQIIPYSYMPNNMARVIITAAGKR